MLKVVQVSTFVVTVEEVLSIPVEYCGARKVPIVETLEGDLEKHARDPLLHDLVISRT